MPCSTNFRDKLLFENSTKSLIFDLTRILLPSSYIQSDCEGYVLSDTSYTIEIQLLIFKLCPVSFE